MQEKRDETVKYHNQILLPAMLAELILSWCCWTGKHKIGQANWAILGRWTQLATEPAWHLAHNYYIKPGGVKHFFAQVYLNLALLKSSPIILASSLVQSPSLITMKKIMKWKENSSNYLFIIILFKICSILSTWNI